MHKLAHRYLPEIQMSEVTSVNVSVGPTTSVSLAPTEDPTTLTIRSSRQCHCNALYRHTRDAVNP